jgi:REP element-mobilizing transposase RayT
VKRVELCGDEVLHVILRLIDGLPNLRCPEAHAVLKRVLECYGERGSFRVVHYTLVDNHVHLIVEAGSREDLTSGMIGLKTSLAKQWNKLVWKRHGRVFAERYFVRVLRTPTEVRYVLQYVFKNATHHGYLWQPGQPDPLSSAGYFDGWQDFCARLPLPPWLRAGVTWLLRTGWARAGPLFLTTG